MRIRKLLLSIFVVGFVCSSAMAAEELTLIYSGASYGNVYGTNKSSKGVEGGLKNRAQIIDREKAENNALLFIDTGNNIAGVVADPHKSDRALDRERSVVSLNALAALGYDAYALGRDEVDNIDLISRSVQENAQPVVAANLDVDFVKPYVSVHRAGLDIVFTAVVDRSRKLKVNKPLNALKSALKDVDLDKNILVLSSSLPYKQSIALLDDFPQIDILLLDKASFPFFEHKMVGNTLVLSPFALGKKLGKVKLNVEKAQISEYEFESINVTGKSESLNKKLNDVVPACFSDDNCVKKDAMNARCVNPGIKSECLYAQASKPKLDIVTIEDCKACDSSFVLKRVKGKFADLEVSTLDYRSAEAKKLLNKYKISTLPAFIFSRSIHFYDAFDEGRDYFIDVEDNYLMHPVYSGIFYFLDRALEKGKLDVFVDISSDETLGLLTALDSYKAERKVELHFVGKYDDVALKEELMRVLAVKKLYPQKLHEYLIGRLEKDIRSSYWSDLLESLEIEVSKIVDLARSQEGEELFKENDILIKELNVGRGGVLLIDNRKIFAVSKTSDADLKDYLE